MPTNEKGVAPCGPSRIGALVALCKEAEQGWRGNVGGADMLLRRTPSVGKKGKAVEP